MNTMLFCLEKGNIWSFKTWIKCLKITTTFQFQQIFWIPLSTICMVYIFLAFRDLTGIFFKLLMFPTNGYEHTPNALHISIICLRSHWSHLHRDSLCTIIECIFTTTLSTINLKLTLNLTLDHCSFSSWNSLFSEDKALKIFWELLGFN